MNVPLQFCRGSASLQERAGLFSLYSDHAVNAQFRPLGFCNLTSHPVDIVCTGVVGSE